MDINQHKVILYFYTQEATFIQKDIALLGEILPVYPHSFPAREKWKTPLLFVSQMWFLLRHLAKWKRAIVVCQFAGYHSLLPCLWAKISGIKSVIVAGGTDCVAYPSLKYGHFQNRLLSLFTCWSYLLVHTVSAVHESLFWRKNDYDGPEEAIQGIRHFVPDAGFRENVIPNGYDTQKFAISTAWEQRPAATFLSVSAGLESPVRMKLKGIDLVLALAERLPDARFTLVGGRPKADQPLPSNVRCIPFIENSGLPDLYNQHQFYLQLSVSEGFPNALCEAMASGCVPIVSQVASMPEIVNHTGLTIEKRDIELLTDQVNSFLNRVDLAELSTQARARIVELYPLETRSRGLRSLLKSFDT